MSLQDDFNKIIGKDEGETLEYKAVLPPSILMAKIICSFANTEGGHLVLGVNDKKQLVGLSSDFQVVSITHKALALLKPSPKIEYENIYYSNKNIFVIKIEKSLDKICLEDRKYIRKGTNVVDADLESYTFKPSKYQEIKKINDELEIAKEKSTNSKLEFIKHYQNIFKIMDNLSQILYPEGIQKKTIENEGKTLTRILFSSLTDNFETYLSGLLYEIFLSNPKTLISPQTVTLEEVLKCADLDEFIKYYANKKIGQLQKGSVRGFVEENSQIKKLDVIRKEEQDEIEKILQIRHLYSHRNGMVDDKFLNFFRGEYERNTLHEMSIEEVLKKINFLIDIVKNIDQKAIEKYSLATV